LQKWLDMYVVYNVGSIFCLVYVKNTFQFKKCSLQ
jgi:hypothetical protein